MTDLPHYPRFVERRLIEPLADTPVVLIHGPRQCGKTTLALVVGEREGYTYLTFDDHVTLYAIQPTPLSGQPSSLATAGIIRYHTSMTEKQDRALATVFRQPISGDIKWRDVESLLKSLGAEIGERSGSRVAVFLHGRTALLHRPHPSPSLDKGAVRDSRRFLESTGVKP